MPLNRRCCCDCPTKEESGIPDSLVVGHEILTSTDDGMPSPSGVPGGPFFCDPEYVFQHATSVLGLLSDVTYDYVATGSSSCGGCCYHFEGRGEYTPECPEDVGSDWILFGTSRFFPRTIGGVSETRIYDGPELPNPDPSEPYDDACCPTPTTLDCFTYCGMQGEWLGGDISIPLSVHGTADLYICVSGDVVTICEIVNFVLPCKTISGTDGDWIVQTDYGQDTPGDCTQEPTVLDDINTTGGETEGCATTGATLTLTATGDLSEVSGANIWEKIKNAPEGTFVSDYEFSICSCAGGGCGESDVVHLNCGILHDCHCLGTTGVVSTTHEDEDVDIDCEYAVGTIELTFDEEAAAEPDPGLISLRCQDDAATNVVVDSSASLDDASFNTGNSEDYSTTGPGGDFAKAFDGALMATPEATVILATSIVWSITETKRFKIQVKINDETETNGLFADHTTLYGLRFAGTVLTITGEDDMTFPVSYTLDLGSGIEDVWHTIEFEFNSSGDCEVFLDEVSQGNMTSSGGVMQFFGVAAIGLDNATFTRFNGDFCNFQVT